MGISRLSLILALGSALGAGEPDAGAPPKPKAEAEATVTVTAEATNVEVAKTPNPVKVVTAEQIQRLAPRSLADLLAGLFPGQLISNGGIGTASSFSLAGARSQDVVVTLDGIRLTDASGLGSVNPSQVGMVGIERVEVQQGPCSTRFGAEAMGGVVALYSAGSAASGLHGHVEAAAGSHELRRAQAAVSYGFQRGFLRAAAEDHQEAQATETARKYRNQGAFLSGGLNLGEDHLLTFTYRNTYQGVPIPYEKVAPTSRVYDPERECSARSQQLIGSLKSSLGATLQGELSLGHATTERLEPNDFAANRREPFRGHRNQAVGSLNWDPSSVGGLSLGVDAYEEFARLSDYAGGEDRGEGRYLAANLEGRLQPVEALRLVGSFRQQWFRQAFVFARFPGVPDETTSRGTWKLGANLQLPAGHRAYVSGGTGFGLPFLYAVMYQAKELLNPASWNYNPAAFHPLQPEKSRFMQAGWSWQRGPWAARVEASRTRFDRLVYFDLNSFLYANGQDIRIQGVEGALAYRLESWGLEGFLRNQEARDEGVPEARRFCTDAVLRRPFNTFGMTGYGAWGDWRADLRWSWSGARYDNFGGFPAALGASGVHFNELTVALRYRVRPGLDLTLRGEHLLQKTWTVQEWKDRAMDGRNDAYQVFGFPAQPRTLSLEARYRF